MAYAGGPIGQRKYHWENSGVIAKVISPKIVDVCDFEVDPFGREAADNGLAAAIESLGSQGGTVLFRRGVYLFTRPVNLPSRVVLAGEGSSSIMAFDLGGLGNAINMTGTLRQGQRYALLQPAQRGELQVVLPSTNGLVKGDVIRLSLTSSDLTTSDWAKGSIGQIVGIAQIDGNTLTLTEPLRLDLDPAQGVEIAVIDPVEYAGIQCVKVLRRDTSDAQTSNIFLNYAMNCFVRNVTGSYTNFAHVDLRNSCHISVENCHFSLSHKYGGGGEGYGVVLQFSTGSCLVQNNIFQHLRHAILLQAGANGNVVGYNYSTQPYWEGTNLPQDAAGDIVLHGNYPFANLFEGNVVQNMVVDASHGYNGPHNAFFNNTVELYGLFVNPGAADSMTIIGNAITNEKAQMGNYFVFGSGHIEISNKVKGRMYSEKTNNLPFETLYLPFGHKVEGIVPTNLKYVNAAQERFLEGYEAACQPQEELEYRVETEGMALGRTDMPTDLHGVYPNPSSGTVTIAYPQVQVVKVLALNGTELFQTHESTLNLVHLAPGLYVLSTLYGQGLTAHDRVLIE